MFLDLLYPLVFIFVVLFSQMVFLSIILLSFENPIYSIFLLVLLFFEVSFLLVELNMFFLSLMILIIYLGALIVLFLFVVMMLNIKSLELNRSVNFFPSIFIVVFSFFLLILNNNFFFFDAENSFQNDFFINWLLFTSFFNWTVLYFHYSTFLNIGFFLYSFGFWILILLSFILLAAMIGAIVLTLTNLKGTNKQNQNDQLLQFSKIELL